MFLLSTDILLAWRAGIIGLVTMTVAPWEYLFDLIEDQLIARGVHLNPTEILP